MNLLKEYIRNIIMQLLESEKGVLLEPDEPEGSDDDAKKEMSVAGVAGAQVPLSTSKKNYNSKKKKKTKGDKK